MGDVKVPDMVEIMTKEEFEAWVNELIEARMREAKAEPQLIMTRADWLGVVLDIVHELKLLVGGIPQTSVKELEQIAHDLDDEVEEEDVTEGGPPYDSATAAGMYDHDDFN